MGGKADGMGGELFLSLDDNRIFSKDYSRMQPERPYLIVSISKGQPGTCIV